MGDAEPPSPTRVTAPPQPLIMSAGDAQPPASAGHDTGSGRLGGTRVRQQTPPRAWRVEAGAHPVPITSMWAEHLAGKRASTAPLTPPSTQAPALAAWAGRRPPDPAARSETERSRRESATRFRVEENDSWRLLLLCLAALWRGEGAEQTGQAAFQPPTPAPPNKEAIHALVQVCPWHAFPRGGRASRLSA